MCRTTNEAQERRRVDACAETQATQETQQRRGVVVIRRGMKEVIREKEERTKEAGKRELVDIPIVRSVLQFATTCNNEIAATYLSSKII